MPLDRAVEPSVADPLPAFATPADPIRARSVETYRNAARSTDW